MPTPLKTETTPLIKWVGGKRQLQQPILKKIESVFDSQSGIYFEPFFGGGAILLGLRPLKAVISDINSGLVNLYKVAREQNVSLAKELLTIQDYYNLLSESEQKDHFAKRRAEFNAQTEGQFLNREGVSGAANFIFLNKAGFNGMYRENAHGEFNIPFGKRRSLNLFDEENLKGFTQLLENVEILNTSYKVTVQSAQKGDLVYFDPPYAPLSKTSSFEGYNSANLGGFDQRELRDVFVELTDRGVHCLLSNSSATVIETLYKGFNFEPLMASRAISASAAGRKAVKEYLIDNFAQI